MTQPGTEGSERGRTLFSVADDHVRATRRIVVSALSEAGQLSYERTTRAQAEKHVREAFVRAMSVMDRAREAYREAGSELDGQWADTARKRAIELGAVRRAMDASVRYQAPHLAGVSATMQERLPGLAAEVMASEVGTHTVHSSVETAARLLPPSPAEWDTSAGDRIERAQAYAQDVWFLSRRNEDAATGLRRVTGASTHDCRGATLQIECYKRMDPEQLRISEAWREVTQASPAWQAQIEKDATKAGVPPMPAVPKGTMTGQEAAEFQKEAVEHAVGQERQVTAPPKPMQAPTVGMTR